VALHDRPVRVNRGETTDDRDERLVSPTPQPVRKVATGEGTSQMPRLRATAPRTDETLQWPPPADEEMEIIWLDGKPNAQEAGVSEQSSFSPKPPINRPSLVVDSPSLVDEAPMSAPSLSGVSLPLQTLTIAQPVGRLPPQPHFLPDLDLRVSSKGESVAELDLELMGRRFGRRDVSQGLPWKAQRRVRRRSSGAGLAALAATAFVSAAIAGAYMPRQLGKTPAVPPAPPAVLSNVAVAPPVSTSLPEGPIRSTRVEDNGPRVERQLERSSRATPQAATDRKRESAVQPPPGSSRSATRTAASPVTSIKPDRAVNGSSASESASSTTLVRADNIVTPAPDVVARPASERSAIASPLPAALPEPPAALPSAASAGGRGEPDARSQDQRAEVEKLLQQYQLAYGRLDASAAKAIWPALDERALARAFDGLDSQIVRFDGCTVYFSNPDAEAVCSGVVTYVTKVGSREPRSDRRRWTFRLRKTGDSWTIVRAEARQGGGL
jgi:hypothetical protein